VKAALYERHGAAAEVVLRGADIELPDTGPGEVRVRVEVSGVNPTDWKLRSGATPQAIDRFQIPHHDAAGVIDAVGSGVSPERLGQRVWGGFDPDTDEPVSDDVADLTAQVFRNVEVLLPAAGAPLDDIVSCLVHLSDLAQFAEFNASYAKQIPGPVKPVRTTVGNDLAAGMRVEVTVVARRPGRAASAVTPAGR
jgi:enamine deaminase RidA (YjgF/YER057c/UK114 family)